MLVQAILNLLQCETFLCECFAVTLHHKPEEVNYNSTLCYRQDSNTQALNCSYADEITYHTGENHLRVIK